MNRRKSPTVPFGNSMKDSLITMRLKTSERGGARLKLIIFLVIFAIVVYAGYLYLPVAVDAYYFKDVMQNKVDMAAAQGYDSTWVKDQLTRIEPDYHVPPEAVITVGQKENRIEAHVHYTRPISIPGYTYNYEFDHTALSGTFLTIK
jgi:hypothetical protein